MDTLSVSLYKQKMIKIASNSNEYITLKNGSKSPIYINLRDISTHTHLLDYICLNIHNNFPVGPMEYDFLCGVPYGGIHYAIYTSIVFLNNKPYLIKRKERKKHGLNNLIDGCYSPGDCCVLIEDVVTTGSSLLNTIKEMEECGIKIVGIIVIIDRCQGGIEYIRKQGYNIKVLLTVHEILNTLERKKLITQATVSNVCKYIDDNHIRNLELMTAEEKNRRLSYSVRLSALRNPLAQEIFKLMYKKKTNVALSLDVPNKKLFLSILKQVAPHICMLKTHINIIDDFDTEFIEEIRSLQSKFKFFIMEDGKFCDIGNTLQYQLTGGIYKINNWANSVTAHGISGKSLMDVYEKINKNTTSRGLVLVAEMSNKHNLISKEYTDTVIDMVSNHSANNVMGFVSQQKIAGDEYLYLTPGVGLLSGEDNLDQRYRTPEKAIRVDRCDIIIVGRAIYNSDDPLGAIIELKQRSWNALLF